MSISSAKIATYGQIQAGASAQERSDSRPPADGRVRDRFAGIIRVRLYRDVLRD